MADLSPSSHGDSEGVIGSFYRRARRKFNSARLNASNDDMGPLGPPGGGRWRGNSSPGQSQTSFGVEPAWMYSPLLPHGQGGLKDTDSRLQCFSCRSLPDLDEGSMVRAVSLDRSMPDHICFWWSPLESLSFVERAAKFALEHYHMAYLAYLMTVIALGSSALLATGDFDTLSGALFMSCSAATQAGLAIVDYAGKSGATHVITWLLIIAGSPLLLTLVPVMLRLIAFRSFRSWCEKERSLMPSPDEHGALEVLARIIISYWCTVTFLGTLLLAKVEFPIGTEHAQHHRLLHLWHGLFMATSAFQNSGLALTPSSVEHLVKDNYALYVTAALIILGNTGAPIVMRIVTVCSFRTTTRGRRTHDRLALLLAEPRHFYTHIFSAAHTTWLFFILLFLLAVQMIMQAGLDWDNAVLADLSARGRVANIFFQGASTRTAGLNSLPLEQLSLPTNFIFVVCMYISTSPVTVTMRSTNVRLASTSTIGDQVSTYFTQHATILVFFHLLILFFEMDSLTEPETCESPEACDLRGRFSFFKVVYEIVSAYGTVGLSLGSAATGNSFCADWTARSQIVLCAVMLLGRTRDLPHSINHAFNIEAKGCGHHAAHDESKGTQQPLPWQH